MLRRLPTTISITSDDLASFEEFAAHRLAYLHYKKTGEDPDGLFEASHNHPNTGTTTADDQHASAEKAAAVDPNDELKPLPGDKGRSVRGREERIMGVPGARGR